MKKFSADELAELEGDAVVFAAAPRLINPSYWAEQKKRAEQPEIKQAAEQVLKAEKQCDLSTQCPACGQTMQPEHAHYRCACGYRDSCCF